MEASGPRQAAREMRVWVGLTLMVDMHLASARRPFRKEVFFNFVEMVRPSLLPGETPHFRNLKNQRHFPHPLQLHLGINIRPRIHKILGQVPKLSGHRLWFWVQGSYHRALSSPGSRKSGVGAT